MTGCVRSLVAKRASLALCRVIDVVDDHDVFSRESREAAAFPIETVRADQELIRSDIENGVIGLRVTFGVVEVRSHDQVGQLVKTCGIDHINESRGDFGKLDRVLIRLTFREFV